MTTNSRHPSAEGSVVENLLGQQFKLSQPNTVWVSDITYVPTEERWLYLVPMHRDLLVKSSFG